MISLLSLPPSTLLLLNCGISTSPFRDILLLQWELFPSLQGNLCSGDGAWSTIFSDFVIPSPLSCFNILIHFPKMPPPHPWAQPCPVAAATSHVLPRSGFFSQSPTAAQIQGFFSLWNWNFCNENFKSINSIIALHKGLGSYSFSQLCFLDLQNSTPSVFPRSHTLQITVLSRFFN